VYGKIGQITKSGGGILDYRYAASGQRVSKAFTPPGEATKTTWYLREPSGNVLATISDKRIPVYESDGMTVAYYDVDLLSATDYYPFGMQMPGRVFNSGGYRFGFGGYEKDNEVSGNGNSYTTTYRHYDPRIGRFKSRDPKAGQFPWWTPYQYAGNRPIDGIDLEGAEYITYLVRIYDGGSGAAVIDKIDYRDAENFNYKAYSESFGPEGRGVKFIYQYVNDAGTVVKTREEWDVRQEGMTNRLGRHGLFMGAGAVTTVGPLYDIIKSGAGNTYDWSQSPIDGVDAAAKKHDLAHDAIDNYQGWLEDSRTLASDRELVEDFDAYYNEHKAPWWKLYTTGAVRGIDKYTGREASDEALFAAKSGSIFFGMVNRYKEWKIGQLESMGLDPYAAENQGAVSIDDYKGKWYQFRRNAEYKVLKSAAEATE